MTDQILIDIPVARAIVAHHGRERGLAVIAGLADRGDHNAHDAAFDALGSKIERSENDSGQITIESVFALHEVVNPDAHDTGHSQAMYWDNGGVVMLGRTIPETVAIALQGQKVDRIVAHPCIAGLIAETIDVAPSSDGDPLIVIDLAAYTCALDDVANHIQKA